MITSVHVLVPPAIIGVFTALTLRITLPIPYSYSQDRARLALAFGFYAFLGSGVVSSFMFLLMM